MNDTTHPTSTPERCDLCEGFFCDLPRNCNKPEKVGDNFYCYYCYVEMGEDDEEED